MPELQMPVYHELLWPTLRAVRDLGGSATIKEIVDHVLEQEAFSEEQQQVFHDDGPQTEIEYRLAWARTNLKGIGALTNSSRGVWSVTELGRALDSETVLERDRQWRAELAERRREREKQEDADAATEPDDLTWKDYLLPGSWTCKPTPSNGWHSDCSAKPGSSM